MKHIPTPGAYRELFKAGLIELLKGNRLSMNWTRRESGPFDTHDEALRVMDEMKETARKNGCHEYADALHIEHE